MSLEQLKAKRNELGATMKKIADEAKAANGIMTAEQEKAFDVASDEFDKTDAAIKRLEKADAAEKRLSAVRPSVGQAQITGGPVHPEGPEAKSEFSALDEFMVAVMRAGITGRADQRLEFKERSADGDRAEQRMDDGPSGGFMVPTQFRGDLLSVEPAASVVRPRALVIPAGSPPDAAIQMPALDQGSAENMFGGVVVTWIGEGATKPETDAKIKNVTLAPKEVAAHVVLTDKLLRNWQAAGTTVSMLLRQAMAAAEDYACLRGDGVARPLGILNAPAAMTVNREVAATIRYADVVAMEARLTADAIPVWLTTRRAVEHLRKMEDSEGHLIWTGGSSVEGRPSTLLGYPVIPVPRLPGVGSKGDLMLVDLRYYVMKDGSGPFVAMSEHVHFTTNKTVIKAFWNVDGTPWMNAPIVNEDALESSPFVLLDVVSA